MEQQPRIRWPELVRELASFSSMTQLGKSVGVTQKEVKRWQDGKAKPQGGHAQALLQECDRLNVNWRKFAGLSPVYDFAAGYDRNVREGPKNLPTAIEGWLPRVPASLWDKDLNSPLGVPASALTINSQWIGPLARLGFDVITAKTCRTSAKPAHPLPNVVYIPSLIDPVALARMPHALVGSHDLPREEVAALTLANSFGMPSVDPSVWREDLRRSVALLHEDEGQVLIASVVGTADDAGDDLIGDFVECAKLAAACEPDAIELNFSCPNVYGREGSIYHDARTAADICAQTRAALPSTRILVKIGYLVGSELEGFVSATYQHVDGYTAINTVAAQVLSEGQNAVQIFPGDKRATAGISGVAIRQYALETVRQLRMLLSKKRPDLAIIGVGGIATAEHAKEMLKAGANVVQICSAALLNPLIAAEIRSAMTTDHDVPRKARSVTGTFMFDEPWIAKSFERANEVSRRLNVPFHEVWRSVDAHFLGVVEAERFSASSVQKTRIDAPGFDQIREWVLNDAKKKNRHS